MNPSSQVVQIRRMTPADIDRVIEIAAGLEQAPHWPRSAYLFALDPQAAPLRIALVAEAPEPGTVAGFAVASLLEAQAELEIIAVAPHAQRCGLARQLFAALAAEPRAVPVAEVILEARASNQPALQFYRRIGFLETGRRTRYYQNPVEDSILMRLGIEVPQSSLRPPGRESIP